MSGRRPGGARLAAALALCAAASAAAPGRGARAAEPEVARARTVGSLEVVATVGPDYPAGVAVSKTGRVFLSCPNQDGGIERTLLEVKGGRAVPYPDDRLSRPDPDRAAEGGLVSVQALLVDAADRLWLLDSGFPRLGAPPVPGGPKLVAIDLATDRVARTIRLDGGNGALDTTFLNDLRIDLGRGPGGTAYVTDSAPDGRNAIVVVDLASGRATRRLQGHPSVTPEPGLRPIVEGRFLMAHPADGGPPRPFSGGVNGIAVGPGGAEVFYTAFTGRRLYSVSAAALADPGLGDAAVAATVRDLGEKGVSGGLESDAAGNVYLANPEHNAVFRRAPGGAIDTVAHDPRLLWPDTLALGQDGHLYVTASQYARRPQFQADGRDRRERPFALFRVRVDAAPVELGKR